MLVSCCRANLGLSLLNFSSPQATIVQPRHLCCPSQSSSLTLWACLPELHSALQHKRPQLCQQTHLSIPHPSSTSSNPSAHVTPLHSAPASHSPALLPDPFVNEFLYTYPGLLSSHWSCKTPTNRHRCFLISSNKRVKPALDHTKRLRCSAYVLCRLRTTRYMSHNA